MDTNVAVELSYEFGEWDQEPDDVVVEDTFYLARKCAAPIECRGCVADPQPDGTVTLWISSQAPFGPWRAILRCTGWDADHLRVRSPDVGGGFGQKVPTYVEEIVVTWVADQLRLPVRWIEDRYENFVAGTQARDCRLRGRLVLGADARIKRWEVDFVTDLGAHNFGCTGPVGNVAIHALGAYRVPSMRVHGAGVLTNKTPTSQYRGAGRPEATFALERSLDRAADRLGVDRTKARLENLLGPDDLPYSQPIPYRDGVPIVYDGGNYRAVLEGALARLGEDVLRTLRQEHEHGDVRVGFGSATYMEATARGPQEPESARVVLQADGTFGVWIGAGTSGQGHGTTMAQIAAASLSVPMERVRVVTGDTGGVSQSLGSFASRVGVIAGSAVKLACEQLMDAVSDLLGVDGLPTIDTGSDVGDAWSVTDWVAVAELLAARRRSAPEHDGRIADATDVTVTFAPDTVTWTMGAHAAVVAVDTGTGHVRVLDYVAAHEGGTAINPRVVDGQIRGGVAQGIGEALLEAVEHDADGQPTKVTLAEYLLPTTADVPLIGLVHLESLSELNPLGAKGVGESGIIPTAAVIASAVEDALRSGYVFRSVPVRDVDVLRVVMDAEER